MYDVHEPVVRLRPVLVNHDVNVRGAPVVVTRVDGGYLYHATGIGVPTTTKPGLRLVEAMGTVPAVIASCIG